MELVTGLASLSERLVQNLPIKICSKIVIPCWKNFVFDEIQFWSFWLVVRANQPPNLGIAPNYHFLGTLERPKFNFVTNKIFPAREMYYWTGSQPGES